MSLVEGPGELFGPGQPFVLVSADIMLRYKVGECSNPSEWPNSCAEMFGRKKNFRLVSSVLKIFGSSVHSVTPDSPVDVVNVSLGGTAIQRVPVAMCG